MAINILMCTFNGGRYLREQIDSILSQTYKDWILYIRDDGSTDGTLSIVKDYCESHPGKIVLMESSKHMGYPDCFWDILYKCPKADYYAFSDQDDVWASEKLERSVSMLEEGTPSLYIHDYDNCYRDLELISHHRLVDTSVLTDRSILFYTYASGFCMVINNSMRDLLRSWNLIGKAMYHDELCIWLAYFHGKILYDDGVLTKYRRHESTVTEYGNGVATLVSNWLRREIFGSEFKLKCERARNFLALERAYRERSCIPTKTQKEWKLLSGVQGGKCRYLRRLFYPHRLRPTLGGELALRIMFFLNRY